MFSFTFDSEGHLLCWQLSGRYIPPPACISGSNPHGFLRAHLAACSAGGNSSRGKSCQPQPSILLRSLLWVRAAWSHCLFLAGSSGKVASDRLSGLRCLLSVSHSTGIFSQKNNGNGKAADHTISQIITKFATKKHLECKCIHTSYLLLRANENKPQALSLHRGGSQAAALPSLPESQAVKISSETEIFIFCLICSTLPYGFSKATKSGGAHQNFREIPLYFPTTAGGGGSGLSDSRVRALCHPSAATDGLWPVSSSSSSVPREGVPRVFLVYELRALRVAAPDSPQGRVRSSGPDRRPARTEPLRAARRQRLRRGQVSREAEEGVKSYGL